jgi:hypothetical protein
MRLQMTKPMACDNVVEFTVTPKNAGMTDVTWAMSGERPFFMRLIGLACDTDEMVGRDFDDGLARLKELVEQDARSPAEVPVQQRLGFVGAKAS